MEKNFEDEARAIAVKLDLFVHFRFYSKELWNVSRRP